MRWIEPNDGDTKIKRKFAFLPISIDGETRWLEWVTVKYEYYERRPCRRDLTGEFCVVTGWVATEFVDDYKGMKRYTE